MSLRAITIGAALLALAVPAAAQQRGTVEFGAFGSAGFFNKDLTLDKGFGAGGHVGIFLDPRIAIEFEKSEMRATRTLGLKDVNVGILSARLVGTAIEGEKLSFLVGAGAGASTETNFLHSYGVNGLIGLKIALGNNAAIRIEGISDWLANNDWKSYQSLHVGLSFFRSPAIITKTVDVPGVAAACMQCTDSVSAAEQARLRRMDAAYRALRDSLSRVPQPVTPPPSSAEALATMQERIHFDTDKSDLLPAAKTILDAKVAVFRANPAMRIIIVGNTDERATDAYNMALGGRRAAAAKAYLVAQGIDPVRIEITSEGERKPTAAGVSPSAQAQNRRDEFRLLIASDYLVPKKP